MVHRLVGGMLGLMSGYLIGMMLGFLFFVPDTDMWALLGGLLAVVGLILGLLGVFGRWLMILEVGLVGFYIGALIGICLFADVQKADLLELLQSKGVFLALAGSVLGGIIGSRIRGSHWEVILFFGLIGGFLIGYIFGVALKLAPFQSLVGWSPWVVGSGALALFLCDQWYRVRDSHKTFPEN